ncbi:hypothetical protein KY362_03310, partial [Candidatus Woesearchaeota archaeon]|nr:hypothetical protein [Candidatus Woesearchaeota archaeon]
MRFVWGRKGKLPIAVLIAIGLGLLIVFAYLGPGKHIMETSHEGIMGFADMRCDDSIRNMRPETIQEDIETYTSRQRTTGGVNELYAPEEAIRLYKQYRACVDQGVFPTDAEGYEERRDALKTTMRSAYINRAEDICTDYTRASTDGAQEELRDEYLALSDDYYETILADTELFDAKNPEALRRLQESQS